MNDRVPIKREGNPPAPVEGQVVSPWRDPGDIFEFELPGVRRDDINIEVGQQELHIYGQIGERERTGVMRHRTRRTGGFDYRVALPGGVDPDKITARYTDGVLTVTVPRAESSRPRRINIT
ncbi:MAG TPA: Hsp20/alpha crystallin family protein [Candidatus Limnocylindrales bacterium]